MPTHLTLKRYLLLGVDKVRKWWHTFIRLELGLFQVAETQSAVLYLIMCPTVGAHHDTFIYPHCVITVLDGDTSAVSK